MFADGWQLFTARDAAIVELAVARIATVMGSACSTPQEPLKQVGMLFVARGESDVLLKLLLDPFPPVARHNSERLGELERQPIAPRSLPNAAFCAFAVARGGDRVSRLTALKLVVVPGTGIGFAVKDAQHARLGPLGGSFFWRNR